MNWLTRQLNAQKSSSGLLVHTIATPLPLTATLAPAGSVGPAGQAAPAAAGAAASALPPAPPRPSPPAARAAMVGSDC